MEKKKKSQKRKKNEKDPLSLQKTKKKNETKN